MSLQKQTEHLFLLGLKDVYNFGAIGLEMLALLCKEVSGDLKAPRSHWFHDPSACMGRMKYALSVKILAL